MSNKLFTLIYGDRLFAAPHKKWIPAKDFSTALDAVSLHDRIQEEAEKYRLEVAEECEQIKEHAFQEGYEEGYKEWAEHLVALENEIKKVHQELQQLIIPVALKAAKKIIGKEIESHEDVIVDIVASNLKAVSQHKKITIYVNKKDLEALEKQKNRIREMFESLESLSIRQRTDVEPGSCIIETEVGIVNGQMSHRLEMLTRAFEKLTKISLNK